MSIPKPTPAATARFDGIDLLRGLSILAVLLLHIKIRFLYAGPHGIPLGDVLPRPLRYMLFNNGGNGVKVFFAISGFLITFTSLRRFGSLAAMQPRAFYRIRFARIAPLLLALLAVLSLLHLLHLEDFRIRPEVGTLLHALFAALTFHLNWYEAAHGFLPANWDVLWSLSVEEMFYFFFPLLCLTLLRLRRGLWLFIAVMLGFIAVGPFARTVWTHNEIWQNNTYLGGTDAIAMGCLTALAAHAVLRRNGGLSPRLPALCLALQALGVALMLIFAFWPRWHWLRPIGRSGTDDSLLALGACFFIFGSVVRRPRPMLGPISAPLRWFGRHSYEVYLTHEFVVIAGTDLLLRTHRGAPALWCCAIVALTAPLGWAVARWFTEPLNRYLRGAAPPLPSGNSPFRKFI